MKRTSDGKWEMERIVEWKKKIGKPDETKLCTLVIGKVTRKMAEESITQLSRTYLPG